MSKIPTPSFRWAIPTQLAWSSRPGFGVPVLTRDVVDAWLDRLRSESIRSIICLLSDEDIRCYYSPIKIDLLKYYSKAGFNVLHVPMDDHRDRFALTKISDAYVDLDKAVVIHCDAGIQRSGAAVKYIA